MLKIRQFQHDTFEKIHHDKFYSNLERYIIEEFTEIETTKCNALMSACRDSCATEKIVNMDGIFAFYVLSFINASPINRTPEYLKKKLMLF